jgi:hypothetical protein
MVAIGWVRILRVGTDQTVAVEAGKAAEAMADTFVAMTITTK